MESPLGVNRTCEQIKTKHKNIVSSDWLDFSFNNVWAAIKLEADATIASN